MIDFRADPVDLADRSVDFCDDTVGDVGLRGIDEVVVLEKGSDSGVGLWVERGGGLRGPVKTGLWNLSRGELVAEILQIRRRN